MEQLLKLNANAIQLHTLKYKKIVPNIDSDKYISAGCDCIAKY